MEGRIEILKGNLVTEKNIQAMLEEAFQSKREVLEVSAAIMRQPASAAFGDATALERMIVDFLELNEFPKKVRILCEDDVQLEMYMMVYNYWFAVKKSERINDGRWD